MQDQLIKYKEISSKNVEVLDLFSFGYQPFRNNEIQYAQFLKETTDEVLKSRIENVYRMRELFMSKNIHSELKYDIFEAFKRVYPGLLNVSQTDFIENFDTLLNNIYLAVENKTKWEISSSSFENRWIVLMESLRR